MRRIVEKSSTTRNPHFRIGHANNSGFLSFKKRTQRVRENFGIELGDVAIDADRLAHCLVGLGRKRRMHDHGTPWKRPSLLMFLVRT